jgi:catechol 2,3-dioxygenase-like lactoylglutathione lyase family enzyme
MIHALDAAVADYEVLLGRRAAKSVGNGSATSLSIQLANVRLELAAATAAAAKGLSGLAFAVADIGKARQLLERRALAVTSADTSKLANVAHEATHHVPIMIVERAPGGGVTRPSPLAAAEEAAAVASLDHVVIRSPNPERAVALYAGRLGLSLRLDRSEPAWGARLLFFRCGDLIVEVAHDLTAGIGDGPDRLWGLSWRVPDIAGAHARLRTVGVDVSDIRTGRRPHTLVFRPKSHTAGVPTLVIGETRNSGSRRRTRASGSHDQSRIASDCITLPKGRLGGGSVNPALLMESRARFTFLVEAPVLPSATISL